MEELVGIYKYSQITLTFLYAGQTISYLFKRSSSIRESKYSKDDLNSTVLRAWFDSLNN